MFRASLSGTATAAVTSTQIAIQPATDVVVNTSGYFSDPYPIQLTPGSSTATQYFSGTTQSVLSCNDPIQTECFTATPITIDNSLINDMAESNGSSVSGSENHNIYQDSSGTWQMVTTLVLTNPNQPTQEKGAPWTIVCHAHPTNTGNPVPTAWQTDTVLEGLPNTYALGNYDGKYFEDSGNLYLLYSKTLTTTPAQHDGVVSQLMVSATQLASSATVVMVEPDTTANNGNGFNSEYRGGLNSSSTIKLVETGNVTIIDGIYAIAYSTGSYQQPWYKSGVAWSDTFIPASSAGYQKVLMMDTAGVWGTAGETEVDYLLQSQEAQWPNYVAAQVMAPGVPSIVNDDGTWYLYFAGFNPSDAPPATGGYAPSHRRPYYVPLQISIPSGATVLGTSPYNLGSWITPISH